MFPASRLMCPVWRPSANLCLYHVGSNVINIVIFRKVLVKLPNFRALEIAKSAAVQSLFRLERNAFCPRIPPQLPVMPLVAKFGVLVHPGGPFAPFAREISVRIRVHLVKLVRGKPICGHTV
jgi:hypothetical protein